VRSVLHRMDYERLTTENISSKGTEAETRGFAESTE
jgi:hypothetical protein